MGERNDLVEEKRGEREEGESENTGEEIGRGARGVFGRESHCRRRRSGNREEKERRGGGGEEVF